MDRRAEQVLVELVVDFPAPLLTAVESPSGLRELARTLGWDLGPVADLDGVVTAFGKVVEAATDAAAVLDEGPDDALALAEAAVRLGVAVARAATAIGAWRPSGIDPGAAAALARELAADLLAGLTDLLLLRRAPRARGALLAAGVLAWESLGEVRVGQSVLRPAGRRRLTVRIDQLGRWLTAPGEALRDRVEAAGGTAATWEGLAEAAWSALGPQLAEALTAAGLPTVWRPGDSVAPASLWVFTSETQAGVGAATAPVWVVAAVERLDGGLALHVVPRGQWTGTWTGERWQASGSLTAAGGFTVTSSAVTASAEVTGTAEMASRAPPALRVGPADGVHLDVGGVELAVAVTLRDGQPPDLGVSLEISGVAVGLGPGGSDSFIGRLLGAAAAGGVDVQARWTRDGGLRVTGGLDPISVVLVEHLEVGPVTVRRLLLQLGQQDGGLAIDVTGALLARLGPIACTVEGLGVAAVLGGEPGALGIASARLGLRPPRGIGLAIAAGPVSGGGYLFFDPDKGEYAGVAELSIGILSLKAVGLLTTRLPDGRPGFSLLLIITAEFPPIQLGFGFTLLGVGGLLGVHRTMAVDPLRDGVRTRALEAILFPRNPVANATQLLTVLRTVFPPAEARFTFGPMVKLGWGPNQLLELEVALILELPSPLKLAVLGRIQALLPNRQAAIVQLRLDVLGILDMDRGEVSVDAALIDSRIAAFTLSGEMALRAGWKATKGFALAVGGFHPRFAPPPGFPALQRLAISLATGDNPRIRLEAYLAITSNTVQFGARLDLWVEAGPFSASAYAGLDALVQFTPFRFSITLSMGIDIAWNGTPFLHAQLEATLEGPTPWHAFGHLEFSILFLKARIGVDITVGEAAAEEPARIDLADVLRAAFEAEDSLAATLPPAARAGVSLRALPDADGPVVHPFGSFTVRQRALPLDTTIGRYGAAIPAPNTASRFELASVTVGTVTLTNPPAVLDDFPAAQFADLSDDERLSRPSFEAMPSGAVVAAAASRYRWVEDAQAQPAATTASIAYDEAVIDDPAGPPQSPRTGVPLDATVAETLLAGGAAARSPARERDAVAGPDRRIQVVGERYVVAPMAKLPLGPDAAEEATSYTQAAEQRGREQQLVTAGEVTG